MCNLLFVFCLFVLCAHGDVCCKLDGFSASELLSLLIRSEEQRGAAACAAGGTLVCGAVQKKSDCNVSNSDVAWTAMQVDSMRDACLARCEAALGALGGAAGALPFTPMCCRFQSNICSLFVSASLGTSTTDLAAACATAASLDLDRSNCVDQLDRACAQQFVDNATLFDSAPICARDVLRPPRCCSDAADLQLEFRLPALDATFRALTAPGFDSVAACLANASAVLVAAPTAALGGFDCAYKASVTLADSPVRGDDCPRNVALQFDAARLPPGTPMCISQYAGGTCGLHSGQRAVKAISYAATGAFTVAQLDVTGDGCVGAADLRCRLAANELARRGADSAPPRLPPCTLAARLALSQCLVAPPPLPFRDWRDRTAQLFVAARNKAPCSADSVPATEVSLTALRPLFFCSGPTAALWLNADESTCSTRCSSAANPAWPLDAVLCCEWRSNARECRVRLGAGKGVADGYTVARDGVAAAQLAQWANRSAAVDCATLAAFALTAIALTYPRYVANTTVGGAAFANDEPYAGGAYARAAAVELLGEAAVASGEARCTTPVSPRCCRHNFGARGAPSPFGFDLLLDLALPTNATCLPPTLYWQDAWVSNHACASDAAALVTAAVNAAECLALCKQHQTEAPYLELCCSFRNNECALFAGGRVASANSMAVVGITSRFLDVTGDGCVNGDDLLCAVQATTTPSRVPLCSSTAYDRVIADCCRDDGMRSPAHVWAAFNGSTPSTRCAINGCVPFAGENRLCRYAAAPLAVWNASNAGACLQLCRAAQFGAGALSASPQLCCQFTQGDGGLCTLVLGDVDASPGAGATPANGDRATTCIAPSALRTAYNESCASLNSVACLVTHAAWGVAPRPACAPLPLPTACCALGDSSLQPPGDIDGDGSVTPNDVAMVARGAFATLPAPLVGAGPQCAASRNDTSLVCGAVATNSTCPGSVVDSINATVRGDATCRAWCESLRPPLASPPARYCCLARQPGGAVCTLVAAALLPVGVLAVGPSTVAVCVQRALMAAAPEVPRVPSLLPSTWSPLATVPATASPTPGCLGGADLACVVGRLARRNDAHNCTEPPMPTPAPPAPTLPSGVSTTDSNGSAASGSDAANATATTRDDAAALMTTVAATDALIGPLVGVGVGALVLGILIGALACFLINRRRQRRAAGGAAPAATVHSSSNSNSSDRAHAATGNRRESLYATVPRKPGGTELAYIDLPAEKEVVTARGPDSDDENEERNEKKRPSTQKVEYSALP
jgi:hypothetical protein